MTKRPLPGSTPFAAEPAQLPLADDPGQPAFLRDLVQAGRDAGTGGYDFDRGLSKHLALIATGAPMPPWAEGLGHGAPTRTAQTAADTAAAAGTAAAGTNVAAWIAGSAVGVALISAAWLMRPVAPVDQVFPRVPAQLEQAPAMLPAAPAPAIEPAVPSAQVPAEAPRAVPAEAIPAPEPAEAAGSTYVKPSARRATAPAVAVGKPHTVATPAPAPARRVDALAAPAAVAAAQPATAPRSAAVSKPRPEVVAERPTSPRAQQPVDEATLEREMAMLAVAQRVLTTDPGRTLSLARQGEAEFAGSMFTQERQQLLLLALVKLGKVDEARRLAKPFLQRYPNGPFSDRVRSALASVAVQR